MEQGKKILLHLTGSIACFKGCALASLLVKRGYQVQSSMTSSALRFVGESSLEGITRRPVISSMFGSPQEFYPHISYSQEWPDLILLYPATAHSIAMLAAGFAGDFFSALFLANNFLHPVWIAPAMNKGMFEHPATKRNLALLKKWGCRILPSKTGTLACGDEGIGRVIEPEEVMQMIEKFF